MKLEAKAKPVKIRVKLGDNEYISLCELKKNFSVGELYPLFKDGRLARWLRQIGEADCANKVDDMAKSCSDKLDLRGCILLMSIFFQEINASSLKEKPELTAENYLKKAKPQDVELIYTATKSIKEFSWTLIIDPLLEIKNIQNYYEKFQDTLSEVEWGLRFAKFVKDKGIYEEFFNYLRHIDPKNEDIFPEFFIEARKNGYKWEKIIDRIEYDSAARLYGVDSIRKLDIPWGEIFARTIHDWDKDSPRVISLIKDDENNLRSFYTSSNKPYRQKNNVNQSIESLIKVDNKTPINPYYQKTWEYFLENKHDAKILQDAITQIIQKSGYIESFDKEDYGYHNLGEMARKILSFLESLINAYSTTNFDDYSEYNGLLMEEWIIFNAVRLYTLSDDRGSKLKIINLLEGKSKKGNNRGFANLVLLKIAKYSDKSVFYNILTDYCCILRRRLNAGKFVAL